jgi:vitamin B12 transporter
MTVNQSKDESETFGTYPSVYNTKRKGSTAQLDYVFTEGQLLTLGYDYYDDQVDSTEPFSETSRDNKAVFAQYQGSFGRFSTALSVREDDNQSFGKYTTESASIGYSITDEVLVSLSYGTAFKAPSFNDLYYPSSDFAFFGTTYRYTGNPDVQPESSKSTELMLRGLHDSFHWSISLYQTEIEDLISVDDLFTSPSLVISAPSNISEAELTGAEVEVGTSLWGWNGTASLSYVDPMDKSDDSMLRRRSRGKADFRVDRDFDQLNFMVFWQAQSYRYDGANASDRLSGFNTVNIRASYTVNPKLELALKVNNIFDDEYKVLKDYNTDGMSAAVSAKYTF